MKLSSPRSKVLAVLVIVPVQSSAVSEVTLTRSMLGGSKTSRVEPSGSGRISKGLFGVFNVAEEMRALSQVR